MSSFKCASRGSHLTSYLDPPRSELLLPYAWHPRAQAKTRVVALTESPKQVASPVRGGMSSATRVDPDVPSVPWETEAARMPRRLSKLNLAPTPPSPPSQARARVTTARH